MWVATLLLRIYGDLQKTYGLERNAPAAYYVTTDASPGVWRGPPGLLRVPFVWAQAGGPQFNTLWEALAVLVSLR
eukprot:4404646-Alexandrium_andersonii.AAC.1